MRQPLLTEEMMDLTLEELVEDFGADLYARETWYGYEFLINIGGTVVSTYNADVDHEPFVTLGDINQFEEDFDG